MSLSTIGITPEDNSNNNSPSRNSRIPVRSSSYKIPKNICFGHGTNRVFQKNWFARNTSASKPTSEQMEVTTASLEDANFVEDMRMALD